MKVFCALIVVLLIILAASRGYDDQLNHEAATYVSGDGPHTPQDWYEARAQARYARRIDAWMDLPRWAAGDFPEKDKYGTYIPDSSERTFMNTAFQSRNENPHGLHERYRVEKLDGENDPTAVYFVLRLDRRGDDPLWTACCRSAARELGDLLMKRKETTKFGLEIISLCDKLENESVA